MQIKQRICNCTDMQIMHFILDKKTENYGVLHAFLSLVVAKSSDLKKQSGFLAHPVDN